MEQQTVRHMQGHKQHHRQAVWVLRVSATETNPHEGVNMDMHDLEADRKFDELQDLRAKLAAAEAELTKLKGFLSGDHSDSKAVWEGYEKSLKLEAKLSALKSWLDQKIVEAKEQSKKATPFDFERGSDLTAYIAVKNWLAARKEQGKENPAQ